MAAPNLRQQLRQTAADTKSVIPSILSSIPNFDATASTIHNPNSLPPLDPKNCPGITLPSSDAEAGRKGTRIRVYNQDTFNTALHLQPDTNFTTTNKRHNPWDLDDREYHKVLKPVAVLNLASERHPGGGWENGALAQEEALCFRSSLYLSLKKEYYPIPPLSAVYSPNVLIIRNSLASGHSLLNDSIPAAQLPVTSVISVAGLRHPGVTEDGGKYAKDDDRETTKSKIRGALRVAATREHRKLVLGALGCGVFGNPPAEVALCFLEVFREEEFQGGWWEDVVFAVLDNAKGAQGGKDGIGNFGVFYRALDGEVV